jgi:hypothetical protein
MFNIAHPESAAATLWKFKDSANHTADMRPHLLLGGVHLDVHIVSNLIDAQVYGQGDETLLPEPTLEQVPSTVA